MYVDIGLFSRDVRDIQREKMVREVTRLMKTPENEPYIFFMTKRMHRAKIFTKQLCVQHDIFLAEGSKVAGCMWHRTN